MGCQQSSIEYSNHDGGIITTGQSERMAPKTHRIHNHHPSAKRGVEPSTQSEPQSLPKLDACGYLLPEEVVKRTSHNIEPMQVTIGKPGSEHLVHVEYAYRSQCGYYPDDPLKKNQDAWSIVIPLADQVGDAFMSIYDGHGIWGHDCARYCGEHIPKLLTTHLKCARVAKHKSLRRKGQEQQSEHQQSKHQQRPPESALSKQLIQPDKWPFLDEAEYQDCCRKALLECNQNMHNEKTLDDNMSGTTAITCHFHGDLVTICNVGDSRAILGHRIPTSQLMYTIDVNSEQNKQQVNDKSTIEESSPLNHDNDCCATAEETVVVPIPLSRDQTPFRRDERERVRQHGAVIMNVEQLQEWDDEETYEEFDWGDKVLFDEINVEGDPPRLWIPGKEYPGTAFTRSIGDYHAESIGVTAEPEMITFKLTTYDEILVIASDGIFQVLTNQQVIDMCCQSANPVVACETLVKAAYDQWLKYKHRIDDITVIVCFLRCDRADSDAGSSVNLRHLVSPSRTTKPSRILSDTTRAESLPTADPVIVQ